MKKSLLFPILSVLIIFSGCKPDPDPEPDPSPSSQELLIGNWKSHQIITYLNGDILQTRTISQDSAFTYQFSESNEYTATFLPGNTTQSGSWDLKEGTNDSLIFLYRAELKEISPERLVLQADQGSGYKLEEVMLKY